MSDNATAEAELGNTGYELFVGALSILSLVNIVLVSLLRDPATQTGVLFVDAVVSAVFLVDFLVRLRRAPVRSDYFFRQYGWADLAASLPFPRSMVLRIFRLIRVARLLRRYGGRTIAKSLIRDRAGSALLTLLFIAVLVLEFGSLAMLYVERNAPEANITTASDALWYVIVTISTVGYGDQYPVTTAGRELGSFIILVGVGIFGTLTGYLANLFCRPDGALGRPPAVRGAGHRRPARWRLQRRTDHALKGARGGPEWRRGAGPVSAHAWRPPGRR
jgi:voltage-gated potassium channel